MRDPKYRFSYRIVIVDQRGNVLVSEKESRINLDSYSEHQAGDELRLYYEIVGQKDTGRKILLKVLKRQMHYVEPDYVPKKKRGTGRVHVTRDDSTAGWQGAFITLTCVPLAKHGGKAGVMQLAKFYDHQKSLSAADKD